MTTIQLKAKKEENILRFHPWIFSGAISKIYGNPQEGDIVRVTDNKGNFLAIGHYQIGSITIRILSFKDIQIDRDFWKERLTAAYNMRQALNLSAITETTAYRLVHGEGDNLPGLVIDIYGNTAVMQAHSVGMHYAKDILAELLVDIIPEVKNVYYKSSNTLPYKAPVKAIELTNKNIELNYGKDSRHEAFAADAFKFLETIDDKYDLIILDPPAFAKHRDALHNALQGYRKINYAAFQKIRKGGILFTFSCSQAVNKEQFRLAVFTAAAQSGRSVKILHQLTQPKDHPINIYHPEGEYLKGLVLYVE